MRLAAEDPRPWVVILALWMLNFTTSAQFLVVAPILPRISEQLRVAEESLGVLVTAYAAGVGICALLAGPISDRFGRRVVLLVGTGWMATALLLHGLAESFAALLLVRGLAGMAGGILSGATIAYIGDWFPYHRRGWANGWVASGFAAGQILGIPGGALLATWSYRMPFVAFGLATLVSFVLVARWLPQPSVVRSDRLSLGSALRTYGSLLRRLPTGASVLAYTLMFLTISLFVTYLPAWLETTFDASGAQVASLFLVGGVANLITGPQAGRLSDRIGRKGMVVVASVLFALSVGSTTWVLTDFRLAYPMFFLVMVFVAMRFAPMQSLVVSLVPARERGALMSLCLAIGQMGFAAGAASAGWLYLHGGFVSNTLIGGAMGLAMAGVVLAFVPEPTGEEDLSPFKAEEG